MGLGQEDCVHQTINLDAEMWVLCLHVWWAEGAPRDPLSTSTLQVDQLPRRALSNGLCALLSPRR